MPLTEQGLLSVGVLVCFSVSSLSQESLARSFRFETFLVFVQSLSAVIASCVAMGNVAPLPRGDKAEWIVVIAAYYASHYFGLASLRHLSYPVHVTFKSCKAIPVAIGERLLTARRHSLGKTLGVVVMCFGVAVFLVASQSHTQSRDTTFLGVAFVSLALAADGLYAGSQTNLVAHCPSEFALMFHMNIWQAALSLASAASTNQLGLAATALANNPRVARDLLAFALAKALGTLCVYKLLKSSGTLVVATITTLRKVLSVLLSVLAFGHAIRPLQWAALRGLRQHHKVYGPRRRYRRVVVGRDEGYSKPSPPQVSIEEARAALIAKFAEEEVGYFYFKDDLGLDDGRLAAITAHGAVLQQRRETLRRKGEWARKALGLEHSQLAALVSLQPTVLGVTSETLRRKIEVLSSYDSRDLGGAVSRAPSLLTRSVAALWRVRRGLGPCAALFDRCPAIAGSERAVFNAKLLPYRVVEAVPEALLASSLEKRLATLGAHGVDVLRWPRCVLYDVDAKLAELGAIAHEEVGGLPLSALPFRAGPRPSASASTAI
ncbi:hypothetical protein CTAYLR_002997 [Chrysophaeum taylorii]|uniref:Uncharacterized protein n=1 Tax=Chrysophaeum taylorii TaxID=2483200 RepID=A0AAD7XGF8_9STRA|nr:hypothetical protein CTAYLR_002997 [Chrysophaeum taylorii]